MSFCHGFVIASSASPHPLISRAPVCIDRAQVQRKCSHKPEGCGRGLPFLMSSSGLKKSRGDSNRNNPLPRSWMAGDTTSLNASARLGTWGPNQTQPVPLCQWLESHTISWSMFVTCTNIAEQRLFSSWQISQEEHSWGANSPLLFARGKSAINTINSPSVGRSPNEGSFQLECWSLRLLPGTQEN